jgi:hypothetical protein
MPPFIVFLLGAVAGVVVSAFAPEFKRNARPMLKEAIKAGILLARGAQVNAVELLESLEDVYAEARAEADRAPVASGPNVGPASRKRAPAARKTTARKAPATAGKRPAKRAGKRTAKGGMAEAA